MTDPTRRIWVVGYDATTCLGADVETTWLAALRGESGIRTRIPLPSRDRAITTYAGQVAPVDFDAFGFLSKREMRAWPSPVIAHAMVCSHRALQHADLSVDGSLAPRTAVTFSTAVGGLDQTIAADRALCAEHKLPKPAANPNACLNMVGGKVGILTGATGPLFCPVGACATGNLSVATGAMLLRQGLADVVICGAADFCLVEVILAGFLTMNGGFRPKDDSDRGALDPRQSSRPFSADRRGFAVAEGAAALILSHGEFVKAHGLRARAELVGIGMTSDANHHVAPHLPTTVAAMRQAIEDAGICARSIGVVNAHAASTKLGDRTEALGLREVFGSHTPYVTANKSQLGHAMGAASAIESVMSIVGLSEGRVPPTINYVPDPQTPVPGLVTQSTAFAHEFVLNNSFGFGGSNCCLVFRRAA